jgi:hypothetical protein
MPDRRVIHIRKTFRQDPYVERLCALAGKNNLLPRLPERYLYLKSYGSEFRDGKWTCDMFFAALPKLDTPSGPLPDSVNWRAWLGEGWEVAG